jgi:ATP adenylyltransferase/5',5'''-P-1,P-4-tetraphosphate phosphorylase II
LITLREDEEEDYNLIGCEHFLMMIPRRKEKAFNDLSVNAIGKEWAM